MSGLGNMFGNFSGLGGLDNLNKPGDENTNRIHAFTNDNRLMEVAVYDVTQGYSIPVTDPNAVAMRFAEFKKRIIASKSWTLNQIEDMVYNRWGIQTTEARTFTPCPPLNDEKK